MRQRISNAFSWFFRFIFLNTDFFLERISSFTRQKKIHTTIIHWKMKNASKLFLTDSHNFFLGFLFSFVHIYISTFCKRFFPYGETFAELKNRILTAITAFHLGCFHKSCIIYKIPCRCKWSGLFFCTSFHSKFHDGTGEKVTATEGQACNCQMHPMYQFQSMDKLKITKKKKSILRHLFYFIFCVRSIWVIQQFQLRLFWKKSKLKFQPQMSYELSHVDWIKWKTFYL